MRDYNIIHTMQDILAVEFNDQEKNLISSSASLGHYRKGDMIVHRAERVQFLNIMIEGLVRGIYIDEDGNEHTKCFSRERDFCATECFLSNREATYDIECLEPVTCIRIPYDVLRKLLHMDERLDHLVQKQIVQQYLKNEAHMRKFHELDAQGRYQSFCEEYPDLVERIKQRYIASYIGVSPVSLSRIKHKTLT